MKIGYISKRVSESGKETFKYIEGNGTRRIGVRSDTIKVKFLYGTTPYEEIKSNTEMITSNPNLVLVGEPFFTDSELKERSEEWCEWANSCKHGEYDPFRDEGGDSE